MERSRIDAKAALMKLGVDVADPGDQVFTFDSRLASKLNEPLENPAPTDDDVNEIDECEEVEDQGDDPLDVNAIDEYEQRLLNLISDGNLNDYSTALEKYTLNFWFPSFSYFSATMRSRTKKVENWGMEDDLPYGRQMRVNHKSMVD
ncbi:hypothetical protein OUZ56_011657 [Daphnia magna]|uniref:Uncharacterized protein n=1 Tax=Daphnia magna TaxID=35525 RepID=A0ABQ9Z0U2_9CRUS|nr:hypothetical protein OUZ56_011657 [Daphnia magna]